VSTLAGGVERLRLQVSGAVQGVGFRPFVYRLAHRLGVAGWISNDPAGVTIEVEGEPGAVAQFAAALRSEAPPRARIHAIAVAPVAPAGEEAFVIRASAAEGARTAVVLPDVATCADCLADVRGADARRAGYAFTNCTNCGPRYSIMLSLPYDRPGTTMRDFVMCAACAAEYGDPLDRRFHAQPNACTVCGPRLSLRDAAGRVIDTGDALGDAVAALRSGHVVAVKGVGGYHLMVDACDAAAVTLLRVRKQRPTKPLAVMAASLAEVRLLAAVSGEEARLLESAEAPIVLLERLPAGRTAAARPLADGVAPRNPRIGVMLPATPLHHLLLARFNGPLVATSGNLSEEPICIDEPEAVDRLAGIADMFLVHDRPIARHVDDSVADVLDGAPRLLRRARGFAPLPVLLSAAVPPILAAGAHMKNAIGLSRGAQVFLSQHIGDLDALEAQQAFERVAVDLLRLYEVEPVAFAHDLHPGYASTRWARAAAQRLGAVAIPVQHHHAHLAACLAENGAAGPALGVIWDGTGYGTDGTIWGGEFLLGDAQAVRRTAHLLPFRLPGGDAAVRAPWRTAAALLHGVHGAAALEPGFHPVLDPADGVGAGVLGHMLATGLNSPVTTSAGRLFDGIAALLGLCRTASFEGEAAILLEHAAAAGDHGAYPVPEIMPAANAPAMLDWRPLVAEVVTDARRGVATGVIAARVHQALVDAMVRHAERVGCATVALSGGCFQNRLLSLRAAEALRRGGFAVLVHREVPPNDGGIALGQVLVAAARLEVTGPPDAARPAREPHTM
jgi:hydrogenase maturation protein HypF